MLVQELYVEGGRGVSTVYICDIEYFTEKAYSDISWNFEGKIIVSPRESLMAGNWKMFITVLCKSMNRNIKARITIKINDTAKSVRKQNTINVD